MKVRLQDMQSTLESANKQNFVNAQKIPLPLTFCGDTLDMNNPFIRERVEREFYSLLGNQGQIQLYFKRTERYLPMIEMYLEAAELPDDLKFIAVHESALLPRIKSRSNAVGLWQFMYHTGRLYKLQIDRYIDERRNPEKATQAATRFLSDLYKKFENWPLVLAAYNSGQGRIQRSLKKQSTDEFITLSLPEETERYYFKIVATKIILSDPENFGFKFSGDDYFHVPALVEIEFKIKQSQMNMEKMAEDFGLDLIEFKEFNPQIVANFLPAGLYTLRIPEDKYIAYQEKISIPPDKTSEEEANPSVEGESSETSWPAMQ
jgi:membrane-bound lytic murein transglycosylase D